MNTWTTEVRPCPTELRREALHVLYQRVPSDLRARLVEDVLCEAREGLIDLAGLWIAAERRPRLWDPAGRHRIVGSLLTQSLAGRAAAVWAPEVLPSLRRRATALAMVRAALSSLRARGVCIAQAVLDESASPQAASDLARGGMPRVTDLLYLERETAIPLTLSATPTLGSRLEWRSFGVASEDEFRLFMQASYISSLDMPELEGVRSLDDILEGHRASGRFVPGLWQLGRVPGRPDSGAVLLLSDVPDRDACEVVYLGLTPDARGQGFGREALARAVELARPHARRVELAVDVRNHPATRLYAATGFSAYDRRSVHLAVFRENATSP